MLELEPERVLGVLDERIRGGLPAQSFGEGRGGERALPSLDREDRQLINLRADYVDVLRQITRLVPLALRLQNAAVNVHIPKPSDFAMPCSNTLCVPTPEFPERGFLSSDDIDHGRKECSRCRKHRHKYGVAYPQKTKPGELGEQGAA